MMRGRFSVLAAVAVVGAMLLVSGCQAIPVNGPVQVGLETLDQSQRGVVFNPQGPQDGATPEDIVRGFVRAASSSVGDYEVAREYLTPKYSGEWDPWLGVLVDSGAQTYAQQGESAATLTLNVQANVDAVGKLTTAPPGLTTTVRFEFEQVDGQWRIASAPAGIILDRETFNAVWVAKPLYFLTADERLVTDQRWFVNRPTLSTQMVRELLAGPAEVLKPAFRTAVPEGTTLLTESVPVVGGNATIDVSADLFDANPAQLEKVKLQIASTLQSVPEVQQFTLQVNGAEIARVPVAIAEESTQGELQQVMVLKDGVFGVVVDDKVSPVRGLSERITALRPTAVTLAQNRQSAAVQHAGGVSWVDANSTSLINSDTGLLAPSLDSLGYVWLFDPDSPTEITASSITGKRIALSMPWLDGRTPVVARVSMNGDRVAVLVRDQGQSAVLVAPIVRNDRGEPIEFTPTAVVQLWASGAPVDLDWIDNTRFATLTESGLLGASRRVTIGALGQFDIDSGAVQGGVDISGGGTRALLRVLDDGGRLYEPQGSRWQVQLTGVDLVARVG